MRAIDERTAAAFFSGRAMNLGNTEITVNAAGVVRCFLFGNLIAERDGAGTRYQTTGWNTTTTRNRLNACGCPCRIFKGKIYNDNTGAVVPAWF